MTLNQLKYAIIVAESESFNEAAKKLFISQPSLSTSIHSLAVSYTHLTLPTNSLV